MFEWRTPEPEPPILDTGYLARLAGHVGPVILVELMADGMIELTDRLARLDELAVKGDLDGIARLGHDLVGMAGHLGLTRLSAAAAGMNRVARGGAGNGDGGRGGGGAAPRVAEVRRLGAESAQAMHQYLADCASPG